MAWERISDHVDRGLGRRAGPYQDDSTAKVLTPVLQMFQEIEDVFWDIFEARILDNATGDALRILGAMVEEYQQGETEAGWKQRIRMKIRALLSDKTQEGLWRVLDALQGTTWGQMELPGYAVVIGGEGLPVSIDNLFRMLEIASADGVHVRVESYADASEATSVGLFTWPSWDGSTEGGAWENWGGSEPGDSWIDSREST